VATVSIRFPIRFIPTPHPKAYIQNQAGDRFVLPWAPRETEHGGDADQWSTLARAGRKPIVRRNGAGIRTLSFSFLMGTVAGDVSIESQILRLRNVASNGDMVLFSHGVLERGWWHTTDLQINPLLRQHGTNYVTRANVTLQLIEAYDVRPKMGRTSTKPKPAKPKAKPRPAGYRYVVVKKGDTLWEFAVKYLGSGLRWGEIARLNGVKDPRKLRIGLRLKIPPR
jgi:LysM repeat protein